MNREKIDRITFIVLFLVITAVAGLWFNTLRLWYQLDNILLLSFDIESASIVTAEPLEAEISEFLSISENIVMNDILPVSDIPCEKKNISPVGKTAGQGWSTPPENPEISNTSGNPGPSKPLPVWLKYLGREIGEEGREFFFFLDIRTGRLRELYPDVDLEGWELVTIEEERIALRINGEYYSGWIEEDDL